MAKRMFSAFLGEGPRAAARQYAGLIALAAALALLGAANQPDRAVELLAIAAADESLAILAWAMPWDRWHRNFPALLALPALAVLAFSTWAFGGFAAGTGPFFVLVFAWLGLHFGPWVIAALTPPAVAAYVLPLVVTHQPPQVVGSVMVLIPTAVGLGLLMAGQAAYQRQAREVISRMERWRAALNATLAHDVRSPLTTVQIALETLQGNDESLPADQKQMLISAALRQTSRIRRLATSLLDAERVELRGDLRLERRWVPLRDAVDEVATHLNTGDLVNDVQPGLLVYADTDRLEQILINLCSNSLRHGKAPISVAGEREEHGVRIEIRDHGPGVPEHVVPQLFTRFSEAGRNPGSVGLGLWIVRELARAHGGETHYEAAEPGARFVVTLPAPTAGPAI